MVSFDRIGILVKVLCCYCCCCCVCVFHWILITRFLSPPNAFPPGYSVVVFFPFISRDVSKWKPLLSFPRSNWTYGFASVFFSLTYSKAQFFCLRPPSSLDQERKDIIIIMYIYNTLIDALGYCRKHLAQNKNILYTSTLYRYIKYNMCKPVPHTLH